MKFVGLDGLKHFWTNAKTWIIDKITTEVTTKIAEIIAEAPEDLDTLKEIADWISSHADDAAAMNAEIKANAEAISGKADKSHTHTKSDITDFPTSLKNPNALTINGKTYDGSTAVDAGVQTVENGGTGATTAKDAFMSLANGLLDDVNPIDSEHIIFKNTSGTNWGLYTLSTFWNYIKGKISSVLGLTATAYSNVQIGGAGVTGSKLTIQGNAVGSNSYTDKNPKLEFKNDDGRQNISLTFTDADAVQAPSSLTLNGNQGNEYFIAPNIKVTGNFHGNLSGKADTAGTADKIEPNYTSVALTEATSYTNKYIKLADCHWNDTGTLQVYLRGNNFADTLVINFGGGNGTQPMLCGHYSGNSHRVYSVIAQKASSWNSDYSIYVKVGQETDLTVNIALLKGNCTINISESTTAPTNIDEWPVNYGLFGTLTGNVTGNVSGTATTADKAVEVVDYGDTSRTVKIGCYGPGVTADKLLYLAGYTEQTGSSVKLKDVNKDELIKWLGIPRIKYADYQTPQQTFTQFEQVPIELSKFSSEVTPNNVLCFMVIYWMGVKLIASADWGDTASSGLKCALIALQAGTGYATIRCVYMV